MRGTVAKRCRKILFALQVKGRAPAKTRYDWRQPGGGLRALGARDVYQGMKLAYKARGGFVAPKPRVLPKTAVAWLRAEKRRRSKRANR